MLREAFELPVWALGGQRLHPAQLASLLEDAMRRGRVGLAGGTYVPERYVLLLHAADLQRFGDLRERVELGLAEHLDDVMRSEGYGRRAGIDVTLRADSGVARGSAEVDATFVEERPAARGPGFASQATGDEPPGATIPIDRRELLAAIGRAEEPSANALAVLTRLDEDGRPAASYGIEALPCTIGRSPACDIVLADLRVSRQHARITSGGNTLVIEDAGSANGTWVDGTRVDSAPLRDGAEVVLGGPRFRFERRQPGKGASRGG